MTPTQLEPYWEQYYVLTELLKEVQHDTQYLQQAITSLERVPSGNIPGDIAGQAKADALGKAIQTRETTHQQLLQIYARMYADLSRVLFPAESAASKQQED